MFSMLKCIGDRDDLIPTINPAIAPLVKHVWDYDRLKNFEFIT
jgi:hypothetical protein